MNIVLATVEVTQGPTWAQILNTAYGVIDLHDHSSGNGVQITPSGLNINDEFDLQGNDLLRALTVALTAAGAADTAKTGTLQRVGTNLYWVNSGGVAVQITNGSSIVSLGSGVLSVSSPGAYPYSVTTGDAQSVLLIDSSVARTVNLPAATNAMTVYIKDSFGSATANPVSIAPNGTDTIEGVSAAFSLNASYSSIGLISDGVAGWYVI